MKNKIIISSILTIALCLSMIAGSTFALFTSEDSVNIAVSSGKLEVVATINDELSLSSFGVECQGNTFANGGTAKIEGDTLYLTNITPGDSVSFTISIANNSNVAIQYRVGMSKKGALATQFTSEAVINNTTYSISGIPCATPWVAVEPNGTIGDVQVTVTLPEDVTNVYQNSNASISFVVEAIQGNVQGNVNFSPAGAYDENGALISSWNELVDNESVVIDNGTLVEYAGNHENVVIADGVKAIANNAFNGNTSLKSVVIPDSVEVIGYGAFNGCTSLESVTIPGGTQLLEKADGVAVASEEVVGTFAGCTSLEEVIIEKGVNHIPSNCFSGCTTLENVYIYSESITCGANAFDGDTLVHIMNEEVQAVVEAASAESVAALVMGEIGAFEEISGLKGKNGSYKLSGDMTIAENSLVFFGNGTTNVLDFNGKTVTTTSNQYAFGMQNGGKLILTGEGTANVGKGFMASQANAEIIINGGTYNMTATGTLNDIKHHALAQNKSKIVINGGTFTSNVEDACFFFATSNAVIEVNGGFFHNTADQTPDYFSMGTNKNNTNRIIITGGTFVNWNPLNDRMCYTGEWPSAGFDAFGGPWMLIPGGYTVISETQANGDVWYMVVPIAE